ncbi:MAG: hypothetical protein IJ710_10325 [Prevotella sp.]|nr:hypothetical protein [Prevotella sp.]
MRKIQIIGMLAAVGLTMYGCGGQTQQQASADATDSVVTVVDADQTIYGICGDGTAMNTLQLVTDNGDTLNLSLTAAQEAGRVLGGIQSGDRMAVLTDNDKRMATLVINETTLLGNWVMPNPIDGSSMVGISLKDGGVAESIDQSTIIYKTWKLVNGRLEIMSIRDGGGEEEEVNVYDIIVLGADSLVYKNEEDEFEYEREKPNTDPAANIELEEYSEEDYKI